MVIKALLGDGETKLGKNGLKRMIPTWKDVRDGEKKVLVFNLASETFDVFVNHLRG